MIYTESGLTLLITHGVVFITGLWLGLLLMFEKMKKKNKHHPSVYCDCEDCESITDLQGR